MGFHIDPELCDEDGEFDIDRALAFNAELLERFVESPEYQQLETQSLWSDPVLYYAANYLAVSAAQMSGGDLNEVLFDLFPRKVSCHAEAAQEIVAEQRAFWTWLERGFQLPNAAECLDQLDEDAADQLAEALSDSSNFGMAKSFFTMGRAAGFDMTTQEGLDAFLLAYNEALLSRRLAGEVERELYSPPPNFEQTPYVPKPRTDWHAKVARPPEQRKREQAKHKQQLKRQKKLKAQRSNRKQNG